MRTATIAAAVAGAFLLAGCATTRSVGERFDEAWIYTKVNLHLTNFSGRFSRVTVDVEGATVTLQGAVDSEAERAEAERAVREIVGVENVVNELAVEPPPPPVRRPPATTAY